MEQLFISKMEPPKRILEATSPFFDDYGYRSPSRAICAIDESLDRKRKPHVLLFAGEPKNGKQHEILDVLSRLYQRKRTKGVLQRIAEEQGYPVPIDAVYWGNAFSVAKVKGRIPDSFYGQFGPDALEIVTEEYKDLSRLAIEERQGQAAIIVVKGVIVAGAYIDGVLHRVNRGLTAWENILKRQGPFENLDYEAYTFGEVAEPDAVEHGNQTRSDSEKVIDDAKTLVATQQAAGEIILTKEGKQAELTQEQQQAVVDYVSESANTASSQEIINHVNSLAVKISEEGLLKLNGANYCLNKNQYYFDEVDKTWRFFDPNMRILASALVMRYIFEENLGLRNRVFIGRTSMVNERILDLRFQPRNVAKSHYPAIATVKNK